MARGLKDLNGDPKTWTDKELVMVYSRAVSIKAFADLGIAVSSLVLDKLEEKCAVVYPELEKSGDFAKFLEKILLGRLRERNERIDKLEALMSDDFDEG